MKEDSLENEIRREDRRNIKAQLFRRRSVEANSGGRYGGKNLYACNEIIKKKHYFNYEGR